MLHRFCDRQQKPLRAHLAGLLTLLSLTQGVAKVVLSDKSVCTGWSKPSPPVHPDLWGLLNSMFQEYISNNSAVARLPMLPRFTFASAGAKRVCVCVCQSLFLRLHTLSNI